jgi:hypothetical protein
MEQEKTADGYKNEACEYSAGALSAPSHIELLPLP